IKARTAMIKLYLQGMDKLDDEMPGELLEECPNIMNQEASVTVNRSYLSESGRFAQGIVTYTNKKKRMLAEARVRCDAMERADTDKVGTQEVVVIGPIPLRLSVRSSS